MIDYWSYDEHGIQTVIDDIIHLYARVFAEPPYCEGPGDVDALREKLLDERARPGVELILARDATSPVGMAYGFTRRAGEWWSDTIVGPPAELLHNDKLAIMEWAVDPRYRGRGIGRETITRLLDGRPEQYAALAVNPRAEAHRVYLRAGWRPCGRIHRPPSPPSELLYLDLADQNTPPG